MSSLSSSSFTKSRPLQINLPHFIDAEPTFIPIIVAPSARLTAFKCAIAHDHSCGATSVLRLLMEDELTHYFSDPFLTFIVLWSLDNEIDTLPVIFFFLFVFWNN